MKIIIDDLYWVRFHITTAYVYGLSKYKNYIFGKTSGGKNIAIYYIHDRTKIKYFEISLDIKSINKYINDGIFILNNNDLRQKKLKKLLQ